MTIQYGIVSISEPKYLASSVGIYNEQSSERVSERVPNTYT